MFLQDGRKSDKFECRTDGRRLKESSVLIKTGYTVTTGFCQRITTFGTFLRL